MMTKEIRSIILKRLSQILSSDRQHTKNENAEFPPHCYRCDFIPKSKQEYHRHLFDEHRHRAGYPNNASLEADNLEPQGMWWET